MKRRLPLLVACLLAISLVSSVTASGSTDEATVVSTQQLMPAAHTAGLGGITLSEVTLTKLADGSYKVDGKATFPLDGQVYALQLDIDPGNGTYTATTKAPDKSLQREVELMAQQAQQAIALKSSTGDITPMQTYRYAGGTLTTKDPVDLDLAFSSVALHWLEYSSGLVEFYHRNKTNWYANPTPPPYNTHWFLDTSIWQGAEVDNGFNVWSNTHYAKYWNQDFAFPFYTYVEHWLSVYGMAGSYDVTFSHRHSGEAAFLLTTYSWEYYD